MAGNRAIGRRGRQGRAPLTIAAMARIIVLQHAAIETPGRLGMTLRDHGFKLDIRRLDLPEAESAGVPSDLDDVRGVVSMGGPQNVGESHWWMGAELALLRAAHEAQLPVIGICLGCQLIAHALGGTVAKMAGGPEVGFTRVSLTPPAQVDRILSGQRWSMPQFQVHGQEVTKLPEGATLLATNGTSKVQAFRAGLRTYAFQYHFETDRKMIDAFAKENAGSFAAAGVTPEVLSRQCDEMYPMFARLGDRLCLNIATLAFTFNELLRA